MIAPRTVVIVQARVGSTRLRGKVLLDLNGRTVLARVVERVRRFANADDVVVATSTLESDDPIVAECTSLGVAAFRGSESDVLDRYLGAARYAAADVCVRITADCPLIDAEVSDHIIERFRTASPAVDYASNKIPQSFPRGLDTEVFTRVALERAAEEAELPYHRVHVTPYMYENPGTFRLLSVTSDVDRADWRWTLDTPEDLHFLREVYARFTDRTEFGWRDVLALLEREPELRTINSGVRQKEAREG